MSIKLPKYPRICKSFKYSEIVNHCITLRIVITNLSSILEITKISTRSKITKFLPKYEITELPSLDTYGWAEFNGIGGELPRAMTAPKSSLTAVSTATIGRWQIDGFQWLGWKPAKLRQTEAVILRFFTASIGCFLVVFGVNDDKKITSGSRAFDRHLPWLIGWL